MGDTQKHTKPNVPNLRFPGFEGDWEQHLLSEYLDFKNGLNPSAKSFGEGIKFISVMDILNNPFITYDCIRASVNATEKEKQEFNVEYGDILFQRSSETLEDVGHANVYLDSRTALFGGFTIRGKKKGVYNPLFFKYLLDSPTARKKVIVKGAGAQHFNIGQEGLSKVVLSFPSIQEQNRIAVFMNLLDQRIAIQNKVIEKYESLIKALAYEILGKHTSNITLSECVRCTSSTLKESDLAKAGTIPAYGAAGISGFTESALTMGDSILITKDGSGIGSLRYVSGPHSFVGTLNSMTSKDGVYLPYIYYALQNVCFESYRTGQAIPHIYFKDYGKEAVYCPSLDDQKRLAKGLEMIDDKIEIEKAILNSLQSLKAHLLSVLFI